MKKEFDFEKFKEEKIAVHCKIQEEYDDFIAECDIYNIRFFGDSTGYKYFLDHQDMTCLSFADRLSYGNWDFYKKEGYTILEWSDYMEKECVKADLKPCYVVKRADGELRIISETTHDIIVNRYGGFWEPIKAYNDDLTHTINETKNIVEVYGFSSDNTKPLEISTSNRELLWKRSEMKKEEIITNNFELEIQKLQKRLDSLESLVSQW